MGAIIRISASSLVLSVALSGTALAEEQRLAPGASVQDYRSALMRDRGIRPTQVKRPTTTAEPKPSRPKSSGGAKDEAKPKSSGARPQSDVYRPPESAEAIDSSSGGGVSVQVYFGYNSAVLTPEAKIMLDKLGEALSSPDFSGDRWFIEGHTDAAGSETYNEELSRRRAVSVMSYLVDQHGLSSDALIPVGKGKSEPYDTANPLSSVNRRVRVKHIGGG